MTLRQELAIAEAEMAEEISVHLDHKSERGRAIARGLEIALEIISRECHSNE